MGLCFTFCFYFIVHISPLSAHTFVKLECNKSVPGIFNENTVLPCRTSATEILMITLTKLHEDGERDTCVFNSSESGSGDQGRIKLRHQDSRDVSLIFQKTQLSDNGTYQYFLRTSHGYGFEVISLMFKAPYTVPQISKKVQGGEKGLECTTCGYPLAQLHWKTENETNLTTDVDIVQTKDKLYNITGYIPVVGEWCSIDYICSVCLENICISERLECSKIETIYGQRNEKKRAAVGVFFFLAFLMLLIFSAFFYCRNEISQAYFRTPSELPLAKLVDDPELK